MQLLILQVNPNDYVDYYNLVTDPRQFTTNTVDEWVQEAKYFIAKIYPRASPFLTFDLASQNLTKITELESLLSHEVQNQS